MKNILNLALVSVLSCLLTLGAYKYFEPKFTNSKLTVAQPNFAKNVNLSAENIDFTSAAENAIHYVVHVKNVAVSEVPSNPFMEFFYGYKGGQQQVQVGTGSGVIITEDGYIVTNNHVVQNASELEITLNDNSTHKAKLIGTDSKMDIALLKIETDKKLPYAVFGDSDNIKVGEWVLAVGNPYNLNSTVTAGIISAKARDLSNNGIQSFIQTDAAVNQGNSGGALVNTNGQLIGINTMISSPTGSYAGYSFAVPSNITRKIIEDIMQFGNVQRGVLGVEGGELNSNFAKELGINQNQGFYVNNVTKNSGAEKAGLKKGDVIVSIDQKVIKTYADLTSYIQTKRPNEKVNVGIIRNGYEKNIEVILTKKEFLSYEFNGVEFEDLDQTDKQNFRLQNGVKIKSITNEEYLEYSHLLEGAIILSVDGQKFKNVEQISNYLSKKKNKKAQYQLLTKDGKMFTAIL